MSLIVFNKKDLALYFSDYKDKPTEDLRAYLVKYYSYGNIKPEISINEDLISITIDSIAIESEKKEFEKIQDLCDAGKYKEAQPRIEKLLLQNPSFSEYHRVYGQILFDEKHFDAALNKFIDALRWDNKNVNALIMLGNIFAYQQNDTETALKYYNKVVELDPKNFIALNNIAGIYYRTEKIDLALENFQKTLELSPDYSNANYGIALCYYKTGDLLQAFEAANKAYKNTTIKSQVAVNSFDLMGKVALEYHQKTNLSQLYKDFAASLEQLGGKKVEIISDPNDKYPAHIEIAESHQRDKHLLKHKPNTAGLPHKLMHELTHLKLVLEARKINANEVFKSTQDLKLNFIKKQRTLKLKLIDGGMSEEKVNDFLIYIFDGILTQLYNAPIDLFIEQYLFDSYPTLRPLQYLSLVEMLNTSKIQVINATF